MSYNLYIQSFFESTSNQKYRIAIYRKDYSGQARTVTAGTIPAKYRARGEEPKSKIRGASLEVSIIDSFDRYFTNDDTEFKCVLEWLNNPTKTLFVGYLVLDDCNEAIGDYDHEITLSFTDNLGLLKEITLSEAFGDPDLRGRKGIDVVFKDRKTGV